MHPIQQHLRCVRARQRLMAALRYSAWGLLLGGLAAAAAGLGRGWSGWLPASGLAWLPLVIGPVAGLLLGLLWPRRWQDAAHAVDERCRFQDRAATALEFATRADAGPLHALQLADAAAHLEQVDPRQAVPLRMPRTLPWALVSCGVAAVLLLWPAASKQVNAEPVAPLDFVLIEAERAGQQLDELEQFAAEQQDPEIERLVAELRELIEQMQQPGVDAKDALAKLSEMQALVQQQQAQFSTAQVDAELQAIGEALSLAEATAAAGKALGAGNMEKAAEELDRLEVPSLDQQTRRAMQEQLRQAAEEMQRNGRQSLSQATESLSQGLGADGSQFREGAKRLAGECRKQGLRKKLYDLLRSQCNCLAECKSGCEGGACSSKGSNSGKGGKQWGLASSGNEAGEATAKLGGRREKLTGQLGNEGETETETIQSPESDQAAQRSYREKYAEYEKLSEAVLESEPIPLGHRQTIRRYFQAIRPADNGNQP